MQLTHPHPPVRSSIANAETITTPQLSSQIGQIGVPTATPVLDMPPGMTVAPSTPAAPLQSVERDPHETDPDPAEVVALNRGDRSTGSRDVLSGWGWSTGSLETVDDEDFHDTARASRKRLLIAIGGALGVVLVIAIAAFAFSGSPPGDPAGRTREATPPATTPASPVSPPPEPTPAAVPAAPEPPAPASGAAPGSNEPTRADPSPAPAAAEPPRPSATEATAPEPPKVPAVEPPPPAKAAVAVSPERPRPEPPRPTAAPSAQPPRPEPARVAPAIKPPEPPRTGPPRVEPPRRPEVKKPPEAKKPPDRAVKRPQPPDKLAKATARAQPIDPYAASDKPAPDPAGAYKAGLQQYAHGDTAGALATFRGSLSTSPGFAPTWRGIGLVYEKMGNKALARSAFKRYLALSPDAGDADQIRDRMERLGP
jgi:hypothetical protein